MRSNPLLLFLVMDWMFEDVWSAVNGGWIEVEITWVLGCSNDTPKLLTIPVVWKLSEFVKIGEDFTVLWFFTIGFTLFGIGLVILTEFPELILDGFLVRLALKLDEVYCKTCFFP